jgi:hypothetical protein
MIVEGTVADTYTVQAVGVVSSGQSFHSIRSPIYLELEASLIRAVPGAIDPTRAEIIGYNLNRPSGRPALDENAGVKGEAADQRPGTGGALAVVRTDVVLDATAGNTGRVVTGGSCSLSTQISRTRSWCKSDTRTEPSTSRRCRISVSR